MNICVHSPICVLLYVWACIGISGHLCAYMHTYILLCVWACASICVCICVHHVHISVCMYLCVYICICVHACMRMHLCMHLCVYACMCVLLCVRSCAGIYACVCTCLCIYVCVCTCVWTFPLWYHYHWYHLLTECLWLCDSLYCWNHVFVLLVISLYSFYFSTSFSSFYALKRNTFIKFRISSFLSLI